MILIFVTLFVLSFLALHCSICGVSLFLSQMAGLFPPLDEMEPRTNSCSDYLVDFVDCSDDQIVCTGAFDSCQFFFWPLPAPESAFHSVIFVVLALLAWHRSIYRVVVGEAAAAGFEIFDADCQFSIVSCQGGCTI